MPDSVSGFSPEARAGQGVDILTALQTCLVQDTPEPGLLAAPYEEASTVSPELPASDILSVLSNCLKSDYTEVDASLTEAERRQEIASLEEQFAFPDAPEPEHRGRRAPQLRKAIGMMAVAAVAAPVAFFGVTAGQSAWYEWRKRDTATIEAPASAQPASTTQTTSAPRQVTTTTEAVTTTTLPPYTAQPGELIGEFSFPAICEDSMPLYAQDVATAGHFDEDEGKDVFNTDAPINYLIPDQTPRGACAQAEEYAAAKRASNDPGYETRAERHKVSSQGNASQWQPILVHDMKDGLPRSVYPCQSDKVIIKGHSSTFSAPLADTGDVKPGDKLEFSYEDGRESCEYEAVQMEQHVFEVANGDFERFVQNYKLPDGSTDVLIMYSCSDAEGRRGGSGGPSGSTHRYVLVFEQIK